MTSTAHHAASERVRESLRSGYTFQMSVDVDNIEQGLTVATAALAAGVDIVEMGTPLLKCAGVYNVIPAFREEFPEALLLADMKTMDGGGFEARAVYRGGGNIIDFLAAAGVDSARNVCAVRDEFRQTNPAVPRLAFADILLPQQGPAATAVDVAESMLDAGVDGVGLHLQLDARRATPAIWESSYLADVTAAVFERVGDRGSVQVVGGLSIEGTCPLRAPCLRHQRKSWRSGPHGALQPAGGRDAAVHSRLYPRGKRRLILSAAGRALYSR
jgi:3-hexulose-6-phosphate synthase